MSSPSTLIVNCGVSHVSASVFTIGDDGILRLEDVRFVHLTHDLSEEDQWLDGVEAGLNELKVNYGFGGETHFILPGSLLLTKTIRVPHVEESKQRQIVTFELQQKMPYPLAELVWGYQAVEDDGVEQEVLAAAVRPAIAEAFCERMDTIGFRPVELSAASILDYNAVRHSHIDFKDGEMLVINVGAKSSNLLFINPEGFLIRNIGLGGNSLTQHIADNLGAPFAKAEDVKVRYFSGKTAFAEDDPGVAIMQKNAGQFMTRLSQEVTRSVVTYKRLKKGKAPTRVFLTGRGALLPGLPEYLSETQGLSVDYFDPLRAIRVSEDVSDEILQEAVFIMSEVVGEAGRQFDQDPVEGLKGIDLLPKDKRIQMSFRPKRWLLIAAAICLSLLPLPGLLQRSGDLEEAEQQGQRWTNAINLARSEAESRASDEEELNVTRELNEALAKDVLPFLEMQAASQNWKALLADLQKGLTKVGHIWIDDLSVERTAPTALKPRSKSREVVVAAGPIQYKLKISGRFLVPQPGVDFVSAQNGDSPSAFAPLPAVPAIGMQLKILKNHTTTDGRTITAGEIYDILGVVDGDPSIEGQTFGGPEAPLSASLRMGAGASDSGVWEMLVAPGPVSIDELLNLNRDRLHAFTKAIEECEFVETIPKKTFETRGRGDLRGRRFTFFEYVIITKPTRPL